MRPIKVAERAPTRTPRAPELYAISPISPELRLLSLAPSGSEFAPSRKRANLRKWLGFIHSRTTRFSGFERFRVSQLGCGRGQHVHVPAPPPLDSQAGVAHGRHSRTSDPGRDLSRVLAALRWEHP